MMSKNWLILSAVLSKNTQLGDLYPIQYKHLHNESFKKCFMVFFFPSKALIVHILFLLPGF